MQPIAKIIRENRRRMRGSTLAETLVMMIVAGIAFLAIMEGLRLFARLQMRRMAAIEADGRVRDAVFRLEALAASVDSVQYAAAGVALYRNGGRAMLIRSDSVLVYVDGRFADTLLTCIENLILLRGDGAPDTLRMTLRTREDTSAVDMAVRGDRAVAYATEIERIEDEEP